MKVLLLFLIFYQTVAVKYPTRRLLGLVEAAHEEDDASFLQSFNVLSQLRYGSNKANSEPQNELVIEEIYDKPLGLAKVVVRELDGARSELYLNSANKFRLEARFRPDGRLQDCLVAPSDKIAAAGYFKLFQPFSGSKVDEPHLIGPASLLYTHRDRLLAMWRARKVSGAHPSNLTGQTGARMLLSNERIEVQLDGHRLVFMQADQEPDRAPLLARLAAFILLEDKLTNTIFRLQVISIDEGGSSLFSSTLLQDHFALPAWFACKGADENWSLPYTVQEPSWRDRIRIPAASFSWTQQTQRSGDLIVQASKHWLKVGWKLGSSLFDMRRQLLYHLPLEPAGFELSKQTSPDAARNTDCIIMRPQSLALMASMPIDLDQPDELGWRFLVGNAQRLVYLGRVADRLGSLHQIEIKYEHLKDAPFHLLLLDQTWTTQTTNQKQTDLSERDDPSTGLVVGHLFLLASESDCANLHKFEICRQPIPVRFQIQSRQLNKTTTFTNFRWDLASNQATELTRPVFAFNLGRCPLTRASASMTVSWRSTVEPDQERAPKSVDLASFVLGHLNEQLWKISPNFMVSQVIERSALGVRRVRFHVELMATPSQVHQYQFIGLTNSVGATAMTIAKTGNRTSSTLFECLTYAASDFSAEMVLYEKQSGECLTFALTENGAGHGATSPTGWIWPIQSKSNQSKTYLKYQHAVVPINLAPHGKDKSLDELLEIDLPLLNEFLADQAERPNDLEACLDSTAGRQIARDIRLSRIRAHKEQPYQASAHLEGWRFAPSLVATTELTRSRQQLDCSTLSRCRASCNNRNHCASFAFCRHPDSSGGFCQVADFEPFIVEEGSTVDKHQSDLVKDRNCVIYTKDYLQFYSQNNKATPQLNWATAAIQETSNEVQSISIQQCARSCLLRPDPSCVWMAYCPHEPSICLHWHIGSDLQPPTTTSLKHSNLSISNDCFLYKRRSISFFSRLIHFDPSESSWLSPGMLEQDLTELDAEECAERCLESAQCSSFDICLEFGNHRCKLMSTSAFGDQMSLKKRPKSARSERINGTSSCEHYELSRAHSGRQVAALTIKLARDALKEAQLSYAARLVVASSIGLTIGLVINYTLAAWDLLHGTQK